MRNDKDFLKNIQVFRGSKPRQDVFSQNAGIGCCDDTKVNYDKLGCRVRFDNGLAHSNPTGANDKWRYKVGFTGDHEDIVRHINEVKVGATISVLVVPTYAFVTGISVLVFEEEPGLTFELVTRNGLELPSKISKKITVSGAGCCASRVEGAATFNDFGVIPAGADHVVMLGRDGDGEFALEADEIMLKVKTMPAEGIVTGNFDLQVAISYDIIQRAEK